MSPRTDGENDVLAKVAEMPPHDRAMAERLHAAITASAPAGRFRAHGVDRRQRGENRRTCEESGR